MTWKCAYCGAVNIDDNATQCPTCNSPNPLPGPTKQCPNCNEWVPASAVRCIYCRTALEGRILAGSKKVGGKAREFGRKAVGPIPRSAVGGAFTGAEAGTFAAGPVGGGVGAIIGGFVGGFLGHKKVGSKAYRAVRKPFIPATARVEKALGKRIKCPYCENYVPQGSKKCPYCDGPLEERKEGSYGCPECRSMNINHIGGGVIQCDACGHQFKRESAASGEICPKCKSKLLTRGQARCDDCIGKGDYAKAAKGQVQSSVKMGENARSKLFEMLIITVAGVFSFYFGFPWLGSAIMIMILFLILPSEQEVLAKVKKGQFLSVGDHMGPLITRAVIKIMAVVFVTFQFIGLQPLFTLIFLYFVYFTFPSSFYENQPYKAVLAWSRIPIVFLILITISVAFPYIQAVMPMLLFTFAFLFTFPKRKGADIYYRVGGAVASKISDASEDETNKMIGNIIFFFTCFAGLMTILALGWLEGPFLQVFLIMWVISIFAGGFAGREGRPYVGVLIIGMTFIAFSFAHSGLVGSAVFGPWWPQVESFVTNVFGPAGDALSTSTNAIGDVWLLITCPSCYFEQQAQRQRIQSTVTEGGTVRSIESKIELLGNPGEIDPSGPLVGSIELENRGEFIADGLILTLGNVYKRDPKASGSSGERVGDLYSTAGVDSKFTSCGGGDMKNSDRTCEWNEEIYPDDLRMANFIFSDGAVTTGDLGTINSCDCIWFDKAGSEDNPTRGAQHKENCNDCDVECKIDTGLFAQERCEDLFQSSVVYERAGWTIKTNASYKFNYTVNVSLPLDIIDSELLDQKLAAREIGLVEKTSQYQGGPVVVSIWTQKQPIRDGEISFGQIAISNTFDGRVKGNKRNSNPDSNAAKFTFYLPNQSGLVVLDKSVFEPIGSTRNLVCDDPKSVTSGPLANKYLKIKCTLETGSGYLDKDEIAYFKFQFKYDIEGDADQRSILLIGNADYTYEKEAYIERPLSMVPMIQ